RLESLVLRGRHHVVKKHSCCREDNDDHSHERNDHPACPAALGGLSVGRLGWIFEANCRSMLIDGLRTRFRTRECVFLVMRPDRRGSLHPIECLIRLCRNFARKGRWWRERFGRFTLRSGAYGWQFFGIRPAPPRNLASGRRLTSWRLPPGNLAAWRWLTARRGVLAWGFLLLLGSFFPSGWGLRFFFWGARRAG